MIVFVEIVLVLPETVRLLHHVRQNQSYVIAVHHAVVVRLTGPIFRRLMNVDEEIEPFSAYLTEFHRKKPTEPDEVRRWDVEVSKISFSTLTLNEHADKYKK